MKNYWYVVYNWTSPIFGQSHGNGGVFIQSDTPWLPLSLTKTTIMKKNNFSNLVILSWNPLTKEQFDEGHND